MNSKMLLLFGLDLTLDLRLLASGFTSSNHQFSVVILVFHYPRTPSHCDYSKLDFWLVDKSEISRSGSQSYIGKLSPGNHYPQERAKKAMEYGSVAAGNESCSYFPRSKGFPTLNTHEQTRLSLRRITM